MQAAQNLHHSSSSPQPVPVARSIPQQKLARILELRRDIEQLEADLTAFVSGFAAPNRMARRKGEFQ